MSLQSSFVRLMLRKAQIWNKPLDEIRKTMESMKAEEPPKDVKITKEVFNGVPCDVFSPFEEQSKKVTLYFHGGGFCLGIFGANRAFAAKIARRTHMKVIMPRITVWRRKTPFPQLWKTLSQYIRD